MDLQNLISCIQCHNHTNQIEVILETFKTIVQICINESNGKDAFREEGGLEFLMEFLANTDSTILLEHSLKTLAFTIDENIHNQMHMTKSSVFDIIKSILLKQSFQGIIHKNALILLSAIMYQNNAAQVLLYETSILHELVALYNFIFPSLSKKCSYSIPNMEEESVELWLRLNSTLCFAVNNPQNGKNQEICSVLFSPSLSVLETSLNNLIISAVCSFLSLCISNNVKNQDYFAECDGLLTLKRCFQKYYDFLLLDTQEYNSIIGRGTLQTLNSLVGIISAAVTNHEKNAYLMGKIGVISLMIKLLYIDMLDLQLKTRLYLSLGQCVDACSCNKYFILETENFDVLLKKNLKMDNEELSSACSYLLQVCILEAGNFVKPVSIKKQSASRDKRRMSAFSSPSSEKYFSNKLPESEVAQCKANVNQSINNLTSMGDIKMYLLAKTQENSGSKSLKSFKTKESNSIISRVSSKRPAKYSFSHTLYPPDENLQTLARAVDSESEISYSPSCISYSKRCKTTPRDFPFNCNSSVTKPKIKHKRKDSHRSRSIQGSSIISPSFCNEPLVLQRSIISFEKLNESLKEMNHTFNQLISSVSNSSDIPMTKTLNENKNFSNESVDSFVFKDRHGLSDVTNTKSRSSHCILNKQQHSGTAKAPPAKQMEKEKLPYSPGTKFLENKKENCDFQECTSTSGNYFQTLKEDGAKSFNCNENFKQTSDKFPRSNMEHRPEFSEISSSNRELRDFTFHPNMLSSSCSEVYLQRKQFSYFEEKSTISEKGCDSNFIKVLAFPWKTCEDHGLVSSFEMLQVVSIEDEDEY